MEVDPRIGRETTRDNTKQLVDDCGMLLNELRVDEGSYLLSERMMSPNRAENNLRRDEHRDLRYRADLGEFG